MTCWTDKDIKEFDEYYDKLKTYKDLPNEELIQIFKDENAKDRDFALTALKEKKEPTLPDLFLNLRKDESIRENGICFQYAMQVLYLNDFEEFQKNCKILEDKGFAWFSEYLTRNTKRFVEEQKKEIKTCL